MGLIGFMLLETVVPALEIRLFGALDGQVKPAVGPNTQWNIAERKLVAAEETVLGQVIVDRLPGLDGLVERRLNGLGIALFRRGS